MADLESLNISTNSSRSYLCPKLITAHLAMSSAFPYGDRRLRPQPLSLLRGVSRPFSLLLHSGSRFARCARRGQTRQPVA